MASEGQIEKNYTLNNAADLDPLMERIGNAHFVLLGEASHGTHEYYTWRSTLSKRLIAERGFRFIAVEGDWPDCYRINRYIKGHEGWNKSAHEMLKTFNRWPTWMWANWEIAALVDWMKNYNKKKSADKKAGFYGLDVYSLWESMEALISYLKKKDIRTANIAEEAMKCFEKHGRNEQLYAKHFSSVPDSCRDEALKLLTEVREHAFSYNEDPEAALNTAQNAHIAVEAEKYYRSMMSFSDDSWNIRDRHMAETLGRLIDFHGTGTKAIVWEHNTHIGDARFTDMKHAGLVNLGQLVREQYGRNDSILAGFGSYSGTVMAGRTWGGPMEKINMPGAAKGSIEEILHRESAENRLLIFDRKNEKERFKKILPHRAIGVVYHHERELHNYVPSELNGRYDAFIYLDRTNALNALHFEPDEGQVPETYPFEF